jgi:hypothetical protein
MDTDQCDTLLRSSATTPSRRNALRLLAGSALGGLVGLARVPTKAKKGSKGKGKGKKRTTNGTTTICHHGRTIEVSNRALKAHQQHGDREGPCPAPRPAPPACGTGAPCRVFVTSTTHKGDFGGLIAADAICQQRAQAANLPGTYKAWLSDTTTSPDTRFVKSPGPYHLVNGTKVADNYADLTDHSLAAVIDRTELGQAVSAPFEVWTFTDSDGSDGSDIAGTDHCGNWTATSGEGHFGMTITTSHNWTNWNSELCSKSHHLYCFQQS